MFSPENVKDGRLACLKTVPVMSQTSDRLRREQTGSIWSNFHKEKESHRWRKRCRDRLGLCLLLFCWITPSSQDWTRNSCSSRRSVMGQDLRRREIWKWRRARGGDVCVREVDGEAGSKWGELRVFVLWISAEPALTSTDLTEGTSSGLFQLMITVWLWSSVSFTYIHMATLHHLVLLSKHASEKHSHVSFQKVCPHTVAYIWNDLREERFLTKSSSVKTLLKTNFYWLAT